MSLKNLFVMAAVGGLLGTPQYSIGQDAHPGVTNEADELPVRYDEDLLSPEFHAARRALVLQRLPDDALAVVLNMPEYSGESDESIDYRPAEDLYYLTGMHEVGSALLLVPSGIEVDGEVTREILLVPPASNSVWTDRTFGPERAARELGIRSVRSDRFEALVTSALSDNRLRLLHLAYPNAIPTGSDLAAQIAVLRGHSEPLEVPGSPWGGMLVSSMLQTESQEDFTSRRARYVRFQASPDFLGDGIPREAFDVFMAEDSEFDDWVSWRQVNVDGKYSDTTTLRTILTDLRTVKAPEEVALIQRAIDITAAAQREAMRTTAPGLYEYEVKAAIEYVFKRSGAERPAFPGITGSGHNAVVLHYRGDRKRMEPNDVVVLDIGAEYHGYSADVTRTIPVDGKFSAEQRAIYEIVLRAQEEGIEAAVAGAPFTAPHEAAVRVATDGLIELGLLSPAEDVRRFFLHSTSHYLGLGVHDVGDHGELRPGSVITVEPGIYIAPSKDIDRKWWHIGVRIEDDVLITEEGPVNMSAAAPRAVEEIEALMAEPGLHQLSDGHRSGSVGVSGE